MLDFLNLSRLKQYTYNTWDLPSLTKVVVVALEVAISFYKPKFLSFSFERQKSMSQLEQDLSNVLLYIAMWFQYP